VSDRYRWWQTGVIYQIYPRSFKDGSGDGIGDLPGVLEKLDYLAWLGVDALWFSPIYPSPMADFGYDVADYTNIHPDFGTLADFDRLLDAAHGKGIKILLDLVPNHTSNKHPWFLNAKSSRKSAKRDWYIWRDPAPDGGPPNNWLAYFGGPAWTLDKASGQYYMHNFLPQQPELNWRNPAVAKAMFGVVRFWLDRGVDGFRVDVVDRIIKDAEFRDNPVNPTWRPGDNPVGQFERTYSEGRPEVHETMREFRRLFDSYADRVIVGEVAYLPPRKSVVFYGQPVDDGTQGDELHLPFNFGMFGLPWEAGAIKAHVDEYESVLPPYAWPNYTLNNHDSGYRLASRLGEAQARIAAMLLLTLRGTPTLYYGDEVGMSTVPIAQEQVQDPQGINIPGTTRDPCRTPLQWDAGPNAGFCPPEVKPWLPISADYHTDNVATGQDDPTSMLSLYKRLLDYRYANLVMQTGRYIALESGSDDVFAYVRERNGTRRLIALNFSSDTRTVSLAVDGRGQVVVSTHMHGLRQVDPRDLTLRPDEGVVIAVT
jgi:alpha-glucosidase